MYYDKYILDNDEYILENDEILKNKEYFRNFFFFIQGRVSVS